MQVIPQNSWFHGSEFMRAAATIHQAAAAHQCAYLGKVADCKYLQLYIDQRTGHFIIRSAEGRMLSPEEVYAMFPSLAN